MVESNQNQARKRQNSLQVPVITRDGTFAQGMTSQNGDIKSLDNSGSYSLQSEDDVQLPNIHRRYSNRDRLPSLTEGLENNGKTRGRKGSLPITRLVNELKRNNKTNVSPVIMQNDTKEFVFENEFVKSPIRNSMSMGQLT